MSNAVCLRVMPWFVCEQMVQCVWSEGAVCLRVIECACERWCNALVYSLDIQRGCYTKASCIRVATLKMRCGEW